MGMEVPVRVEEQTVFAEAWPRILVVGASNVGKRSVVQRLLAMGKTVGSMPSPSGIQSYGWLIETKYYTAELCIATASLSDKEARANAKAYASSNQCQALVLIFDLTTVTTFELVKEWVETLDLPRLEILLCVGNKADRSPDHFAHEAYRRRLHKQGESTSDPHPEFCDFGIQEMDGSGLLADAETSSDEQRRLFMNWCSEHGFEYLEACALDRTFDQCISVDGDSQGVNRIFGALSAHMWPGLSLKSEKEHNNGGILEDEENDTDESDVSIDYERLSNGSAEPWGSDEGPWTFYECAPLSSDTPDSVGTTSTSQGPLTDRMELLQHEGQVPLHGDPSTSLDLLNSTTGAATNEGHAEQHDPRPLPNVSLDLSPSNGQPENVQAGSTGEESGRVFGNGGSHQNTESKDFEHLMIEIANMRENSRLMSDTQRREMAANLALRMASLFDEDDE